MSKDDDDKMMSGTDVARKVWLAGLGAYGKAINTSQGAAMKIGAEANKVFEDLVSKGAKLEETVEGAVEETRKSSQQARASVEERIRAMKSQFGLADGENASSDNDRWDQLEAKLDSLEAKIDALIAGTSKQAPKPRTPRKTVAKKTTSKKPAAKKSAPKKTAAKTTRKTPKKSS